MKKIQKIIDTCYECEFMEKFSGMAGGNTKAYICAFAFKVEAETPPFLLDLCSNGTNEIQIPENCPLETYEKK